MISLFNKLAKMSLKVKMVVLAAFLFVMYTVPAWAVGTENTVVTGAFSTMKDDLVATLTPVAIAAIGIAVIFLAFKYGRKIFNTVAK